MSGFAVIATIRIAPGGMATYLPELLKNARASRGEPGCRRFDVLRAPGEDDSVTLYESYDDEAAFESHQRAPHYLAMVAAIGHLIQAVEFKVYGPVD